jgi:hypothetical protein
MIILLMAGIRSMVLSILAKLRKIHRLVTEEMQQRDKQLNR